VRFSPDGRLLVSGGEDGVVKVWDIIAGKLICDFQHHTGPVVSLDFHPNEFLMASGSADGAVTFWDVETFEMVSNATLGVGSAAVAGGDGRYGGVRSIAFIPNGQALLAAYRSSLCAWKWEPAPAVPLDTIGADWSDVMDMAIVNDQLIACTIREAQVGVWMVNMQKINLGSNSTTPHKAPSHFKLQGPTDSPTHPDFQVNSARNALKANNGLSQYKSIDLPPTDDNDDEPNTTPGEDVSPPPKAATPPTVTSPTSAPSPSSQTAAKSTPIPTVKPKQAKQQQPTPTVTTERATGSNGIGVGIDAPPAALLHQQQQHVSGGDVDTQEADFLSMVVESHDKVTTTLTTRYKNLKTIKACWTENGSGTDSKGALAVLTAVGELEDAAVTVDFLRSLPIQRDDFFTLDLCTAMLPTLIELLNHSQKEDYLFLGLSMTQRLVKLFGNLIKTTREAPIAKGVDLSKEERMEKCQACYNNLITINHLIVPLARRSGTVGKNAKDLTNLLRIYIPDV
jgi:katanin p80 WD40 repeat-containing subunit B1